MFLMLLSEERANITFRGLIGEGLWVNYSELHCKKNKKKNKTKKQHSILEKMRRKKQF